MSFYDNSDMVDDIPKAQREPERKEQPEHKVEEKPAPQPKPGDYVFNEETGAYEVQGQPEPPAPGQHETEETEATIKPDGTVEFPLPDAVRELRADPRRRMFDGTATHRDTSFGEAPEWCNARGRAVRPRDEQRVAPMPRRHGDVEHRRQGVRGARAQNIRQAA